MKALKFLGNRVEDAANAFIDVLKYSDQSVDYPDFKDIEPWPEDIVNMFKDALKDKLYYKDIAKRLGVSVGTIGRVINKKSYRDENIDRKR